MPPLLPLPSRAPLPRPLFSSNLSRYQPTHLLTTRARFRNTYTSQSSPITKEEFPYSAATAQGPGTQSAKSRPYSSSSTSTSTSSPPSSNSTPTSTFHAFSPPSSSQPNLLRTLSPPTLGSKFPPGSADFEPLTYHIHRTPSQQLPVYQHAKGGGNKRQTRIRGVEGSREDLARDLCAALKVEEADIRVEGLGGLIVIKGWKKKEVARFLEMKRF
ncbi:hypothetical protein MMC10_002283 [Thelotrema lepadinum]|nr:hypothetical protein [Thelotrema lepadinum]